MTSLVEAICKAYSDGLCAGLTNSGRTCPWRLEHQGVNELERGSPSASETAPSCASGSCGFARGQGSIISIGEQLLIIAGLGDDFDAGGFRCRFPPDDKPRLRP
jgi:hypothetical protein